MKEKIVAIYHDNLPLMVFESVAEQFGLRSGEAVGDEIFWALFQANAEYGLAICELQIAVDEVFDGEVKG